MAGRHGGTTTLRRARRHALSGAAHQRQDKQSYELKAPRSHLMRMVALTSTVARGPA